MSSIFFLLLLFFNPSGCNCKDVQDYYTDLEIERLYEQWEENDEDEDADGKKPDSNIPNSILDSLKEKISPEYSPDELLKTSKKGQTVMMFVSVKNPDGLTTKGFTEKISSLWQSNLYNNHIDAQNFVVDDDRILFLFKEGSQAWDARDYLLTRRECNEITLEGKTQKGNTENEISKQEL